MNDPLKPEHYHRGSVDVIGFAEMHFNDNELIGFHRINVLKYVTRYDNKGTALADLEKAAFYLQKLIEIEKGRINNG